MTANEHTGVLGPMHGKEWKKSGGKEYNGDNEPAAEFVMTLDKLEPGQAGVILELNTGGGMRRRLMDLGFSAGEHVASSTARRQASRHFKRRTYQPAR